MLKFYRKAVGDLVVGIYTILLKGAPRPITKEPCDKKIMKIWNVSLMMFMTISCKRSSKFCKGTRNSEFIDGANDATLKPEQFTKVFEKSFHKQR